MPVADVERPGLLGKGLYTQEEAAALIGLRVPGTSRQTVASWAYGRAGGDGDRNPVFSPEIPLPPGRRVLTFLDLIELHFIAMFRREGVSMRAIRLAAKSAAERFNSKHPFAVKRFGTDGTDVFATQTDNAGQDDAEMIENLRLMQMVMGSIAQPFFRALVYDYDAVTYWPLGKQGGVILDPDRQFGKPIVASAGVPTAIVYEMSRSGESIENIAEWYDISVADVLSAIEMESRMHRE